jgi:hypothetical protein
MVQESAHKEYASHNILLNIMLIFHFSLKYRELIKCFGSLMYGINITIVRDIICEGNERIKPVNELHINGKTYIGVNNL